MRYALPAPGGPTRTHSFRRGLRGLGLARAATDIFTMPEIQFLANEWPSIRVAANWTDIGWKGLGYPSGPPLSTNANAIVQAVWGDIRRAAKFSDINWGATGIPANLLPATAPVVAAPVAVVVTQNYNGSPLNSAEYATISGVWPTIRAAANWKDISWPALNYPNGPGLSAGADAAMGQVWGQIRVARWFQDINWSATKLAPSAQAVPEITKAPAQESPPQRMQIPEAAPAAIAPTVDTPAAQPVPEIAPPASSGYTPGPSGVAVSGPTSIPNWWESLFGHPATSPAAQPVPDILAPGIVDPTTGAPVTAPKPVQAGMFGNLPPWLLPAVGAVLFLSLARSSHQQGRRMRRRKRRA
jgi:hypothetical protein